MSPSSPPAADESCTVIPSDGPAAPAAGVACCSFLSLASFLCQPPRLMAEDRVPAVACSFTLASDSPAVLISWAVGGGGAAGGVV